MENLVLLGTGRTLCLYNGIKNSLIWSLGSVAEQTPADLYFCMHGEQCGKKTINRETFPFSEVKKAIKNPIYFSSFDYMIALAIARGFKKIYCYGFDMEHGTEYSNQRQSAMYYLGVAQEKGIEVIIPKESSLNKNYLQYGSTEFLDLLTLLKFRKNYTKKLLETEQDSNKVNQFIGQLYEIDFMLKLIGG